MITDDQLTTFVNTLGSAMFVMIVAYHYLAVNGGTVAAKQ